MNAARPGWIGCFMNSDAPGKKMSASRIPAEIPDLRSRIDRLDTVLLYILAERFAVTDAIGALKRDHDLPALDADREAAQRRRLIDLSRDAGLAPEIIGEVFSVVTSIVRRRHDEIRDLPGDEN